MSKQYAVRETKTTDADIDDGDPIVRETWVLEYEDGHADVLQRRHPVTDPAEREVFLNDA